MQNLKLTIQYNGSRYLGWQKPDKGSDHKTVSYRITSVLSRMTGASVVLHAGAKTEARVHALAQTVNFQTDSDLSPEEFQSGLNRYLPSDIAVLNCEPVKERFRADLNAVSRTYTYRVCTAPVYDVFTRAYTAQLYPGPDIAAMETAASLLIGTHDFRGFSGGRKKKHTQKTILDIRFCSPEQEPGLLVIKLTADDFLYQMPSRIIGALLETGQQIRTPASMEAILQGKEKAETLCDPKGLLLTSVQYESNHRFKEDGFFTN